MAAPQGWSQKTLLSFLKEGSISVFNDTQSAYMSIHLNTNTLHYCHQVDIQIVDSWHQTVQNVTHDSNHGTTIMGVETSVSLNENSLPTKSNKIKHDGVDKICKIKQWPCNRLHSQEP